jgi:hypothetical protein
MMQKANASMMLGSSSWLEQFTEAFSVQAGREIFSHFTVVNMVAHKIKLK